MLLEAAKPNVLAEELKPNGLLPSVIENVLLAVPAFPAKSVHDEVPFPATHPEATAGTASTNSRCLFPKNSPKTSLENGNSI
jgi:hypothetical protein